MSRSLPRHRFNLLSAGIGDDLQAPPFNSAPCAFDREPDVDVITYWVRELDAAQGDHNWLAARFLESGEFTQSFGHYASLSDAEFVDLMYGNVLGRAGESDGVSYWLETLESGANRGNVLGAFSESVENQAGVLPEIAGGVLLGVEVFG